MAVFSGTNGNDTIVPGTLSVGVTVDPPGSTLAGNDDLYGYDGDDSLDGGTGDDYLRGDSGNDTYRFGTGFGNDTIDYEWAFTNNASGGKSTDTIAFGAGILPSQILLRGEGSDLYLQHVNGVDTVTIEGFDAGTTIERVTFADGTVWNLTLPLTITGSAGADSLAGGINADTLDGAGGNDDLYGNKGDDSLTGGTGDDYLRGDSGNDTYRFGTGFGNDTIDYEWAFTTNASGGKSTDTIAFGAGITAGQVTLNRVGDDLVVKVGSSSIVVEGQYSGPAIERITFSDSTVWDLTGSGVVVPINGTAGNDTLAGGVGNDVINGLAGNDTLRGLAGDDRLDGGLGNDALVGGTGADTLIGGDGVDYISYTAASRAVSLSLATGGTGGEAEGDSFSGIEGVQGSNYADQITGDGLANTLYGYGGDDTLSGRGGNDLLSGGLGGDDLAGGNGVDYAVYTSAAAGVTLSLATGGTGGEANGDEYSGIEGVQGSSFADQIAGDGLANTLYGNGGNDTLSGLDGNDTLVGGLGADALLGGNGFDVASYTTSTAGVSVNLTTGAASGGDALGDTFSLIEALSGSNLNDTLTGNGIANTLYGNGGNDVLSGAAGNDVLTGGVGLDKFGFTEGFGDDRVTDFTKGQDQIQITGFGTGLDSFAELQSRITQSGGNTVITLDDATHVTITLEQFTGTLAASDFILVA